MTERKDAFGTEKHNDTLYIIDSFHPAFSFALPHSSLTFLLCFSTNPKRNVRGTKGKLRESEELLLADSTDREAFVTVIVSVAIEYYLLYPTNPNRLEVQ